MTALRTQRSQTAWLLFVLRADGNPSIASTAPIRQTDGKGECVNILHRPLGLFSETSDSLAGTPSIAWIAPILQTNGKEWCVSTLHRQLGLFLEDSDSLAALCVKSGR